MLAVRGATPESGRIPRDSKKTCQDPTRGVGPRLLYKSAHLESQQNFKPARLRTGVMVLGLKIHRRTLDGGPRTSGNKSRSMKPIGTDRHFLCYGQLPISKQGFPKDTEDRARYMQEISFLSPQNQGLAFGLRGPTLQARRRVG